MFYIFVVAAAVRKNTMLENSTECRIGEITRDWFKYDRNREEGKGEKVKTSLKKKRVGQKTLSYFVKFLLCELYPIIFCSYLFTRFCDENFAFLYSQCSFGGYK